MSSLFVPGGNEPGRSELGRVKVALKPGKALVDWIRLTQSRELASEKLSSVSTEELMSHASVDDCWTIIHGEVYDITKYLEYHPGGIPELARVAGTDGTKLFDEVHAWVAFRSMLKACYVGPFRGNYKKLPPPLPSTIKARINNSAGKGVGSLSISAPPASNHYLSLKKTGAKSLQIKSHIGSFSPDCLVIDAGVSSPGVLRILVRRFDTVSVVISMAGFDDSAEGDQPCIVEPWSTADTVIVTFNSNAALAGIVTDFAEIEKQEDNKFYTFTVSTVQHFHNHWVLFRLTPNCRRLCLPVPLGQHVLLRLPGPGHTIERPYTPFRSSDTPDGDLDFYIKIYDSGKLTPELAKLNPGDKIEVSDPLDRKDNRRLIKIPEHIVMIAAGTGITPMINLIRFRHSCTSKLMTLLWITRSKEESIDSLLLDDKILGSTRDRLELRCIADDDTDSPRDNKSREAAIRAVVNDHRQAGFFICGPPAFNRVVVDLLGAERIAACKISVFE